MFLYEMEDEAIRQARLGNLIERVLHRLGDSAQQIWTSDEVDGYLRHGAREMVKDVRVVWDLHYSENLPAGFHATSDFEEELVSFQYGVASYTFPDEILSIDDSEMETDEIQQANHTSPSDVEFLVAAGASTAMRATTLLPESLMEIERVTWDNRGIDATSPRRVREQDAQYEETIGEVFQYSFRQEGPRTFRKIRVPSAMAEVYTVDGSWGVLRDPSDIDSGTVEGTWGIPRRIPGTFPMGDTEGWGLARRFYKDETNVRIEHFRQLRASATASELPARYFIYLAHYCQWKCLIKNGPGQDFKTAQLYKTLWDRGLARITSRNERMVRERVSRMGGSGAPRAGGRPPRPKLPWQYGSTVR